MPDPFAAALADLHGSDLAVDAIYTPRGGSPRPLRVIRSQGSEISGSAILDQDSVSIRRSDVALPDRHATVQLLGLVSIGATVLADPVLRITQDPLLDEEGVSWLCPIALL